jgi:hypothetical protein
MFIPFTQKIECPVVIARNTKNSNKKFRIVTTRDIYSHMFNVILTK